MEKLKILPLQIKKPENFKTNNFFLKKNLKNSNRRIIENFQSTLEDRSLSFTS